MAQPWEQLTVIENAQNSVQLWDGNTKLFVKGYHRIEHWWYDNYGHYYVPETPVYVNNTLVSTESHSHWVSILQLDGSISEGPHTFLDMGNDMKVFTEDNGNFIFLNTVLGNFEYDDIVDEHGAGLQVCNMVWLNDKGDYLRHTELFRSYPYDGHSPRIQSAVINGKEIMILISNPVEIILYGNGMTLPAGVHLLLLNKDSGQVRSARPLVLYPDASADYTLFMAYAGSRIIVHGILDPTLSWSIFDNVPNLDKNREFICSLDTTLNIQWLKYIADSIPYRTAGIKVKSNYNGSLFLFINYPARYLADDFRFAHFNQDSTLNWTVVCQLDSTGVVVWGEELWSKRHDFSNDSKSFDIGTDGSLYVTYMHEKPVHFYSDSSKLKGGGLLLRYLGGELLGVREFEPYLNQYVWDRAYPVATSNGYCYVVFGEGVHGNLNGEKDLGADYIGRIAADFTGTESISPSSAGTLKVYPVPNNGVFNIQMPFTVGVPLSYHVFISDMSGRTIYGAPIEHGVSTATIDISTVETGIYNLLLTGGEEPFRGRVLVH